MYVFTGMCFEQGGVDVLEYVGRQVPDLKKEPRIAGGEGVVEIKRYESMHDRRSSLHAARPLG